MRYLRQTLYDPSGKTEPLILVNSEDSFKTDIWTAATTLRESACNNPANAFIEIEIFDHEGDEVSAAIEARRRSETRLDETLRNRLTTYDWLISLFKSKLLADGATISTTRPSPLLKGDLFEVIIEATKHLSYRGFVIAIHDKNGEPVSVYVGKEKKPK